MSYWSGKRAVITGGSAGLGRALAGVLVERGARVAMIARGREALDTAATEFHSRGGDVLAITADVTNPDDVKHLAEEVQRGFGGVDLLCHCAGKSMRGSALSTTAVEYRQLWETNFLAAVQCIQALADPLKANRGHVVLVGSLASKVAPRYLGAYPSSKFPLAALAQQLRLELAGHGVHVLLVCPGPIARDDGHADGGRYAADSADVPVAAHQPGGGAKVRAIDPFWLAGRILQACESRCPELVIPTRARLLFAISQLSPSLGDWLLNQMMAN